MQDPSRLAEETTAIIPPTSSADLPELAGRFALERELGRGGMGVVLRASDPDLGRPLAVKILQGTWADSSEHVRRFLAEARLTAQLQHPGVPPVHEVGTLSDGRPYFAMKLVEGRDLAALLAARTSLSEDLSHFVAIFEQICQAVGFAHSLGIIHRDLKPSNVMVGAFGEVQVMDWGLARQLTSSASTGSGERVAPVIPPDEQVTTSEPGAFSRAGSVAGTPAFMAPEQARGESDRLDARSDVFGLGGILCVILTGKPPFTGGGEAAYVQAANGDLSDVSQRLGACSADAELVSLVRRCLAVDPEQRPANGSEVAAAVAAYRAGVQERLRKAELERTAALARAEQEVHARELAQAKGAAERRAHRLTLGLGLALLLLVGLGAAAGLWYEHERGRRLEEQTRQREQLRLGIEADLSRAEALRRQERWDDAEAMIQRAEQRMTEDVDDSREAIESARRLLRQAARLDEIRMTRMGLIEGVIKVSAWGPKYAEAFRDMSMDVEKADLKSLSEQIRVSPIRDNLVVALDDWAVLEVPRPLESRLLELTRTIDPDPWRNRVRDPAVWHSRAALEKLAAEFPVEKQPPHISTVLASRMWMTGGNPNPLEMRALLAHPTDFWLNMALGSQLSLGGRETAEQGIGYLRAALALRPNTAILYTNLSALSLGVDRPSDALVYADRALQMHPEDNKARHNRGRALYLLKRHAEARDTFQECLRRNPRHVNAMRGMIDSFTGEKKLNEAFSWSQRWAETEPKSAEAANTLGTVLFKMKRYPEAQKAFEQAIANDPSKPGPHVNRGHARHLQGQAEAALEDFTTALKCDPTFGEAYLEQGRALLTLGRHPEAIASFREAVGRRSWDERVHFNLGLALRRVGRLDEAIASYREALRLKPDAHEIHTNLGSVLSRQGKYDDAIACFNTALKLHPNEPIALINLGVAHMGKKQYAEAAKAYRQVIEAGRREPLDYTRLVSALWLAGDHEEAIKIFEAVALATPNYANDVSASLRFEAACAAVAAKKYDKALTWLSADLKVYTDVIPRLTPRSRPGLRSWLQTWQTLPALADVRDEVKLAKLPDEEQTAWKQLWKDVAGLIEKLQEKK